MIEPPMPIVIEPICRYDLPRIVRGGDRGAAEPQKLFLYILRNRRIVRFLHLMAVNAECRQPLLRVRRQHATRDTPRPGAPCR